MDQKDIAFVFLSLIIVYSVAFQIALEATENDDANVDTNDTVHYQLSSTLPAIATSNRPRSRTNNNRATATHDDSQIRVHNSTKIDTIDMASISDECNDDEDDTISMHLIEPHKPRLSTLSGNQHHIVEYHDLNPTPHSKEISNTVSTTILNDANLLITTVDGRFSVLSAEHGSKQMSLDSSSHLYQSPGTAYENKVIPGIDGQLYLLRKNVDHEEYLEPLAFTVEQIAKNTGYADIFNTWYLVDPTNTVFWIDSDAWNVCKPAGNIPDITDDDDDNSDIPPCGDALIVTRIDRQITAVDVNSDTPSTQWRFKHGEYRVAAKTKRTKNGDRVAYNTTIPIMDLQRFQLWQSLDESSKFTLFLYDRHIGEIKWSKSLSSIVTNVKLLTSDHQIVNFYVYHTKTAKGLLEGHHDIGLWVVPSDKYTQIAIAHSNRNPISNHMFLPATGAPHSSGYDADEDDEMEEEEEEEDDDIHIIEEDVHLAYDGHTPKHNLQNMKHKDRVRFVRLSFDGDLDKLTNIPSPATVTTPSWDSSFAAQNRNNAQKYAGSSALKVFNPKQGLLAMDATYHLSPHDAVVDGMDRMEYYYEHNILTISTVIIAALVLYLTPLRMPLKRLLFGDGYRTQVHQDVATNTTDPVMGIAAKLIDEEEDMKVIGKLKYNVKMKLGAGRRGHVFCGSFENRRVAIKRMDKMVCDVVVNNEIDILLKVDHQSNIVRYYAKESDNEFDYIALDLCLCSLWDVIKSRPGADKEYKGRQIPAIHGIAKPIVAHQIEIDSLSVSGQHPSFCCCNSCRIISRRPHHMMKQQRNGMYQKHLMNHCTKSWSRNKRQQTVNYKHLTRHKFVCDSVKAMMRQMLDGVIALHTAKDGCIIHRDIKPQNILIARDDNEYKCKLADMGMAKLMDSTRMSFDSENCGTLFWNAPELIYHKSYNKLPHITHNKVHRSPALLCSIFGAPQAAHDVVQTDAEETEYETDESEYETASDESVTTEEEKMECISSSLTRKVDIFSLGCVFSFLLSKGSHPYGDRLVDQHENMERKSANLTYCRDSVPEVYDLISWMICIDPACRPQAIECKEHPFFWSDLEVMHFLNATSDFIEKCDKSNELRVVMECASKRIVGADWGLFVDAQLLSDAGKHRKYNFESMRDYLRLIRNKWAHFDELSLELRNKLSNANIKSAAKFLQYFTQYCPQLLIYCYKIIGSDKIKSFAQYYQHISQHRIDSFRQEVRNCIRFRPWYRKH